MSHQYGCSGWINVSTSVNRGRSLLQLAIGVICTRYIFQAEEPNLLAENGINILYGLGLFVTTLSRESQSVRDNNSSLQLAIYRRLSDNKSLILQQAKQVVRKFQREMKAVITLWSNIYHHIINMAQIVRNCMVLWSRCLQNDGKGLLRWLQYISGTDYSHK